MALPIQLPGQVNANFESMRQTGGGVKVSTEELQNALGGLKGAVGMAVRIPVPDMSGIQDLGRGIAQVGEGMQQLIEKNRRVNDTRIAAETQTKVQLFANDLEVELAQEKDPSRLGEIAERRVNDFLSTVSTDGMSPEAAHHLTENYLKTWKSNIVTKATINGYVRNEQRMVQSLDASASLARKARNPEGVVRAVNSKVEMGAITPEQGALEISDHKDAQNQDANASVTQAVRDELAAGRTAGARAVFDQHPDTKFLLPNQLAHLDSVISAAEGKQTINNIVAEDPEKVIKDVEQAKLGKAPEYLKGYEPSQLAEIKDIAFSVSQKNSNQALTNAVEDYNDGALRSPAQLRGNHRYAGLNATDRAFITGTLEKQAAEGRKFDPKMWNVYSAMIDSIPVGTEEGKLAAAVLETRASLQFAGDNQKVYREHIINILRKHMDGSPAEADNTALKIINDAFKAGQLGTFEVPYAPPAEGGFVAKMIDTLSPLTQLGILPKIAKEPTPGTAITPQQQAFIDAGGKIKEGTKVIDIQRQSIAAKEKMEAEARILEMRQRGATEREMNEYARGVVKKMSLRGVVSPSVQTLLPSTEKLKKATDVLDNVIQRSSLLPPPDPNAPY